MLCEIDRLRVHDRRVVLDEVVVRLTTHACLQPVDHRETAVVADDHDHLVTVNHRAIDVGVEHHPRAITDKHRDVLVGHRHRRAPTAAGLVPHAAVAVLAVEAVEVLGSPAVVDLAGETTSRGQREGVLVGNTIDGANHLGIGGQPILGGRLLGGDRIDVGVVLRHLGGRGRYPVIAGSIAIKKPAELSHRLARITDHRDGVPLRRIEAGRVDTDDLGVLVLEHGPRTGGEVEQARTNRDHHVGLGSQRVR